MKKFPLLMLVLVSFIVTTCVKKGEDDPTISFRSRRARVEGDWRVQKGTVSISYVNYKGGWRDNLTFALSGSTFNLSRTGYNGRPITGTGANVVSLKCGRDGSFTLNETLVSGQLNCTGEWKFNKRGDGKKGKEYLDMTITTINSGKINATLFNQDVENFSYHIKELRNKIMVLESNSPGYTEAVTETEVTYKNEYTLIHD